MVITYSGKSAVSAQRIADESPDIFATRTNRGDINWGRAQANTLLNSDISNATNKRVMRELFAQHNVPMPELLPVLMHINAGMPDDLELDRFVVGRPDHHMKGRGFWKCETVGDVRRAIRGTRKKQPATHFMEWIDAPREYRVHIFKGKSIRISEKAHTEFHIYTTIKPQHNVGHVRKAAKLAVEALGLDFGAVDILANDTECWVTEVNAAPGLGGSMPKLYAETFKRYLGGGWNE